MVTVVDSKDFLRHFASQEMVEDVHNDIGSDPTSDSGLRMVVDLLVEQVECADLVVLNKVRE